ncbi:MAG: heavy-metal-associated domain-containing protein [Clostridia bacterium]|nr:heavy-metal-associated domain-containing protein [Clostridia bacterium]
MKKITLKIDGMMCGMCESHVNDVIRRELNIKKVTSSHTKGETVIITDSEINDTVLKNIISNTGYTLLSVAEEPYEKKGLFSFLKR